MLMVTVTTTYYRCAHGHPRACNITWICGLLASMRPLREHRVHVIGLVGAGLANLAHIMRSGSESDDTINISL